MPDWNPWHGCHKHSPGCMHCYVYRQDEKHGKDASIVAKTASFDLPIRKNKKGEYKMQNTGTVWTCFTSDFFVEEADDWRADAWKIIKERSDLSFLFITKRIDRFYVQLPPDWGTGYENVTICCTTENQETANYRLPIFQRLPIKHKIIICEPILEQVDFTPFLGKWVEELVVGGESGNDARPCDFDWVLNIRNQCINSKVSFTFRQTGARLKKDGKIYRIERKYQHSQARKANINVKF